jgi:hypothetical protein
MRVKGAQELKTRQLLDKVVGACLLDENWFARGLTSDGRWVSWVIMAPGRETVVYGTVGNWISVGELTEKHLDCLLKLEWQPGKQIGTLDAMARVAAMKDQ